MAGPPQDELFGEAGVPGGTIAVNGRCLVRTQDGHRVVLVAGIVLCQYAVGDRMAEASRDGQPRARRVPGQIAQGSHAPPAPRMARVCTRIRLWSRQTSTRL